MQPDLQGKTIAVLGGDAREKILAGRLAMLGARLIVAGLPVQGENITPCEDLARGLVGVQALILPLPGINDQGHIYSAFLDRPLILSEELLALPAPGALVVVGTARPILKEMVARANLRLVEIMKLDEVAILNSIPSAEGAIQAAMEKLPITIHGSFSLVLGFGRTGATLARMLAALGARTTVVARNPAQRARAYEMGLGTADLSDLPCLVGEADIIFNTIPAPVLDEHVLSRARATVLILDLASGGGTDFEAARRLNLTALLLPGLPGKVAPQTAGEILARVVPRLLAESIA
ncbi:MAG: dipicolinate synthase subunit DpsA [Thermoanaerobacteraceae bacterium]|nr:dipicolinate synthase subunit DpsA [Thermoanaerobacteraceae bacterium]